MTIGRVLLVALLVCLPAGIVRADLWRLESPSLVDTQFRKEQFNILDDLARQYFGGQLNGTKENDLSILQRLLDGKYIRGNQENHLQAMGFVLGQVLKKEYKLEWVIYIDRLGRSRALRLSDIDEFIFPITQISRRAKAGLTVDIAKVYRELEVEIERIMLLEQYHID